MRFVFLIRPLNGKMSVWNTWRDFYNTHNSPELAVPLRGEGWTDWAHSSAGDSMPSWRINTDSVTL
jgi:hypothetical protein